jgi:hypothetical protein
MYVQRLKEMPVILVNRVADKKRIIGDGENGGLRKKRRGRRGR